MIFQICPLHYPRQPLSLHEILLNNSIGLRPVFTKVFLFSYIIQKIEDVGAIFLLSLFLFDLMIHILLLLTLWWWSSILILVVVAISAAVLINGIFWNRRWKQILENVLVCWWNIGASYYVSHNNILTLSITNPWYIRSSVCSAFYTNSHPFFNVTSKNQFSYEGFKIKTAAMVVFSNSSSVA